MVKKKIKFGIYALAVALFAVVFLAVGIVCLQIKSAKNIGTLIKEETVAVNEFKSFNIKNYIADEVLRIEKFSHNEDVVNALKEHQENGEISAKTKNIVVKEFNEFFWQYTALIDSNATVLISSLGVGTGDSYSEYLSDNITEKVIFKIYYDKVYKKDMLTFVQPIFSSNKFIGAVAAAFNLETLKNLAMTPSEYQGVLPLETFVVDESGFFLTPSRYIDQNRGGGVLVQQIKGEIFEKCSEMLKSGKYDETSDVYDYVNYQGDEVYGVVTALSYPTWCVITEYTKNN